MHLRCMTLFGLCAQDYFSRAGHELLDWLGFLFDPADAINFLWYTAEGNTAMAAATAVAIVPAAGSFIAKGTKQAIKAGKKAAQKAGEKAAKNAAEKAAKKAAKKKLAKEAGKEAAEKGAEKAAKEAAEKATEKTAKEATEKGIKNIEKEGAKTAEKIPKNFDPSNIPNMNKQEIIDSIPDTWKYTEHNGFVHVRDESGRIDSPDKETQYPHVHIYDDEGNLLDILGNVVSKKSMAGHIPYKY